MRGYCLLDRAPAPPPGAISQPDARTRTAPGGPHTFQLIVDPLMSAPGIPGPDARVRLLADMTGAGVFVPALDAPLPPHRPETFEFGLAASTGMGTNVHEVRAVRVALSSAGGAAYAPVVVDDALPPGLTIAATPHGSGWACDETVAATRARCTYDISRADPVLPGTRLPELTVPVRVAPDAGGRAVNVATLSGGEIRDPLDAEDPFELRRRVGVRVGKDAHPSVIAPGGRTAFTLVVRNDGPSDARDVVLVDRPPDGLRLVAARASQGGCARAGARLRCELGTVRAGASALVLVDAEASAGAAGQTLRNVAVVSAPDDDDRSDDRSEATVRVTGDDAQPQPPPAPAPLPPGGRAVLEVEKRAERASARVGEPIAYAITVRNTGDAAAPDVVLTDSTNMPGSIATAPALRRACERSGTVVRCRLGTIGPGETVTVRATVVHRRAGRAVNAVALAPPYGTLPGRIDVAGVSVHGGAALRISKRADRTRVPRGGTVRFRIVVRSAGSEPARRIRVCDLLPPGLRTIVARGPGDRMSSEGRRDCWTLSSLAPGRAVSHTVVARTTGGPGPVRNTAVATARNARPVRAVRPLRITGPRGPAYTG
jgi:uncharacterized repeat protein (TIGR01451 family)